MEHLGLFTVLSLASDMELREFFVYLGLLYFLPVMLAMLQGVSASGIKLVALFNILLGWIVVVWLACLAMALLFEKERRQAEDRLRGESEECHG